MAVDVIRGAVFDFGGVLTRSDVSDAQLRAYDALLGLPADSLRNLLYSGEAWELASTGQLSVEDYWEQVGKPYEARLPADFAAFRRGVFHAEPINEAVVRIAAQLRRRLALAICSNALMDLADVLAQRPDIRALFDAVVISAEVGVRKPDPAIFRLTAERLGLPVSSCLLIDDKERNTEAAREIGMPAITFVSPEQLAAALRQRGLLAGDFDKPRGQ